MPEVAGGEGAPPCRRPAEAAAARPGLVADIPARLLESRRMTKAPPSGSFTTIIRSLPIGSQHHLQPARKPSTIST